MTSLRQIEANRRNALKSTGPTTENGKRRSRRNAVRHGLTAETVIGALEDPEDYKAFELSITSEFDAQTAVERELVLRLASLWRLRRTIAIESGLLQLESETPGDGSQSPSIHAGMEIAPTCKLVVAHADKDQLDRKLDDSPDDYNNQIARRFLHLAKLDHGAFRRLGRYETALRRQVGQILCTLDALQWKTFRGRYLPTRNTEQIRRIHSFRPWMRRK